MRAGSARPRPARMRGSRNRVGAGQAAVLDNAERDVVSVVAVVDEGDLNAPSPVATGRTGAAATPGTGLRIAARAQAVHLPSPGRIARRPGRGEELNGVRGGALLSQHASAETEPRPHPRRIATEIDRPTLPHARAPATEGFDIPTMNAPFPALIVACLLCLPLTAAADSHLSTDPTVERARALVTNGQFDAALAILLPLDRDRPDQVDILFLTGLASIGAAERREDEDERDALLDGAIDVLRAILRDRPELVRVRLELARAFFLEGEDDLARDAFERVLAGRPEPAVVANINRFLARDSGAPALEQLLRRLHRGGQQHRRAVRFRVHLHLRPAVPPQRGLAHDLGHGRGGVGRRRVPASAGRAPAAARRHRPRPARVRRQRFRPHQRGRPPGSAVAGGQEHRNQPARDRQQSWTAGEVQHSTVGVRLEATRRVSRSYRAFGQISWQHRDFRASEHLDGRLLGIVGRAIWTASPTVRVDLGAGYNHERTASEVWRNTTTWTRIGVTAALPLGLHRRRQRRAAADELRRPVGSVHPRRRAPQGPDPRPAGHVAQPIRDNVRVQPPDCPGEREPRLQRAALRLQAHPRRGSVSV